MQGLYQLDVQGAEILESLGGFYSEFENDRFICSLAEEWTRGTWENVAVCDELISTATIKWQFARLSPVDRSILRLAVYQLKFRPDVPPKVVINEAIELAKKFSTEKSPAFVNGVLDAVLRRLTEADG